MQATGQKLAETLKSGDSVVVELDFQESMAHPDDRCVAQYVADCQHSTRALQLQSFDISELLSAG